MKNTVQIMFVAFMLILYACSDSPISNSTTGEIYGYAYLINEYNVSLTDNSGITVQLINGGKVIQTVSTTRDGLYSLKGVRAGVYDFRFFKPGYAAYGTIDTGVNSNIQFVGQDRYKALGNYQFYSKAKPDTSYWVIKSDIRYEVIKQVNDINDIWLRDSIISGKPIPVFGSGTKETKKIRFTVDFERALPYKEMKRTVILSIQDDDRTYKNDFTFTSDANALSGVYEYVSPNVIVKDSLGKLVNHIERPGSTTQFRVKKITVQASSKIPNGLTHQNEPTKVAISKEVTVNLLD